MNFKRELDFYFESNYKQLLKNIKFLIIKYKRTFLKEDLLSEAYIYLTKNEQQLIKFANNGNTTLNHAIFIWFRRYTTQACIWTNGDINKLEKSLKQKQGSVELEIECEDFVISNLPPVNITDNIYNEEFINEFYESLDKQDQICFHAYYYDGLSTYREMGEYFRLSKASGRNIVKDLQSKLKQYIDKNKII